MLQPDDVACGRAALGRSVESTDCQDHDARDLYCIALVAARRRPVRRHVTTVLAWSALAGAERQGTQRQPHMYKHVCCRQNALGTSTRNEKVLKKHARNPSQADMTVAFRCSQKASLNLGTIGQLTRKRPKDPHKFSASSSIWCTSASLPVTDGSGTEVPDMPQATAQEADATPGRKRLPRGKVTMEPLEGRRVRDVRCDCTPRVPLEGK